MKGYQYYAERLLSQAISDPHLDETDGEAVRAYIKAEAEKLCLDGESVAEHAILRYRAIVNNDALSFERASETVT